MRHLFILAAIVMLMSPQHKNNPINAQTPRKAVLLETTEGNIRVELYDETPLHRDNFLTLVEQHFYDSLLFHRTIRHFMIQSGDPDSKYAPPFAELGEGGPDYTLPAEIRLPKIYHKRGALAMARESDDVNPEWRSCSSQFYIVYGKTFSTADVEKFAQQIDSLTKGEARMTEEMKDMYRKVGGSPHLDGNYTVFGEVTDGMDVVERIQNVATDDNDRPLNDVRILRATVVDDTASKPE